MMDCGHPVSLRRGETLFAHDDAPGGLYGILLGSLGIEGATARHPLRMGHVMRRGDWLGHGPALSGARRISRLVGMEPSRLLHIPLATLVRLEQEEPDLQQMLVGLSLAAEALGNWVACDLLIPDARRRIAAVLLRIAGLWGERVQGEPRPIVASQAQIAEMANTSRGYANEMLAGMCDRGWIWMGFLEVRIRDPKAMSDFAYGEG